MLNVFKTPVGVVVAVVIALVIALFITSGSQERKVMSALYNANMPLPEWVEIDAVNAEQEQMFITYGLGGKTCKSIISFNSDGSLKEESVKRCNS